VSQTALPPLRWDSAGRRIAYFQGDWRKGRLLVVDATEATPPKVLLESLSGTCDFVWSRDGERIAAVSASEPAVINVVQVSDLRQSRVRVAGRVGEIAWSPGGRSLLATAQGEEEEYFRLVEIEVVSGVSTARAEAAGDVENPVWLPDGRSFIYHVLWNGTSIAVLGDCEHPKLKTIGPTDGVVRVTHVSPDGTKAYARYAALTMPPVLVELPLAEGDPVVAYAPSKTREIQCPKPEFVRIESRDKTDIPAYHWRAKDVGKNASAALIVVHGGLHTQTFPTWEAYLKVMLERGCDVVAINYRGSSGYGATFEGMGSESERVLDVMAARDYALKTLGIAANRVFLTGISHGAGLAAAASARGEEIGGLILVSWVGAAKRDDAVFGKPFPVIELHGELDPTMSPNGARRTAKDFFATARDMPGIEFRVFKDEGHFFYKTASWAQVHWETLKLMKLD
jgi:dipeptidyl aminopeptidase/acylaminoacyl peptidase